MSHLHAAPKRLYIDRTNYSREEWLAKLEETRTVYVGNLSFFTTEEQVLARFEEYGGISRVVIGKNKTKKVPCGFCFIEFESRTAAQRCLVLASGTVFDDRVIRVDWDAGDQIDEDRQFGRGEKGQRRDDFRHYYDPGRGGEGGKKTLEQVRKRQRDEMEADYKGYKRSHVEMEADYKGYKPSHDE